MLAVFFLSFLFLKKGLKNDSSKIQGQSFKQDVSDFEHKH